MRNFIESLTRLMFISSIPDHSSNILQIRRLPPDVLLISYATGESGGIWIGTGSNSSRSHFNVDAAPTIGAEKNTVTD